MGVLLLYLFTFLSLSAQNAADEEKLEERLNSFFTKYKPKGTRLRQTPRMVDYQLDNDVRTLTITADEFFAAQEFTPEITAHIYKKVKGELPKPYKDYQVTIITNGMAIDELIPNRLSRNADKSRLWGNIDYQGEPWVKTSPVLSSSLMDYRTVTSRYGPATAAFTTRHAVTGDSSVHGSSAPQRTCSHRPSSFLTLSPCWNRQVQ